MKPSLLSRTRAEEIFERHKKTLARKGAIVPVVYIALQESERDEPVVITKELEPPTDQLGKEIYYAALREDLRKKGAIVEALVVFEGWTVISKTRPAIRPSKHPERTEILGMMGRNADKSRVTMVQQRFSHTPDGIVWGETMVAQYNVPATKQGEFRVIGIIDYLFPPLD